MRIQSYVYQGRVQHQLCTETSAMVTIEEQQSYTLDECYTQTILHKDKELTDTQRPERVDMGARYGTLLND